MSVTINDVAAAAGVSISTVSRVFSSSTYASARTREQVLAAARSLGYAPNRVARLPDGSRIGTIGFVLTDLVNPFFPQLAVSVLTEARHVGYSVVLVDSDAPAGDKVQLILDLARQVDGLILWSPGLTDSQLDEITDRAVTVTLNDRTDRRPNVILHGASSMHAVMEYLAALNHGKVCYVSRRPSLSWSIDQRASTAAAAAAENGIELSTIESYGNSVEAGRHSADLVIARGATAIVAENDVAAFGIIGQLAARGVRVPEDISVVGFDDTPMAALFLPALTTVRIPVDEVARTAVSMLTTQLRGRSGPPPPQSIEVPAHLVVRNSTAAAKV